jgi:chromosome segregation ATPase
MSHQQRVFNMLAKLSKQPAQTRKTQLALVDDLDKAANEIKARANSIAVQVDDAYQRVADLVGQIPYLTEDEAMLEQDAFDLQDLMDSASEAADALGVDWTTMPAYVAAEQAMETIQNAQEILKEYNREIEPILKAGGVL